MYPIAFLLAAWVATGTGAIGGVSVIPFEPRWEVRAVAPAAICGLVITWIFAELKLSGLSKLLLQVVSIGLFFWFAVAVAGALYSERLKNPALLLTGWAIVGLISILLVLRNFHSESTEVVGTILFISVFPLLNGIADFASFGLTRYWLRQGTKGNLLIAGIFDAIAAFVILALLGTAMIAAVHFGLPSKTSATPDIATVFKTLADPAFRAEYWWLGFVLLSTILPTLVHAAIAVLALFTLAPKKWRNHIVSLLRQGANQDSQAAKTARVYLVATVSLSAFAPLWLFWQAFTARHGGLDAVIAIFEWIAYTMGAIPQTF